MSMQTPSVGVLDITNATLRVGKLEVSSTQGIDSALNVFKANSILLFDNQRTSTTNPFTLSGSAIRNAGDYDSTSNIHLTSGSIYTGLGLPNAWSLEFDLYAPPSVDSGNVEVEFYSTASTGGGGYKVTFNTDDDSNQVILSYAGTDLTSQTAVIVESSGFRKVVIIYERGQISVSIGGTRVLHYKDIERPGPYTVGSAGFFRFAAPGAAVRRVRNIKISNDGPWSYTPNGGIAFLNGQVGIGTNSPTSNLEVAGSVKSRTMVVTGDSTFEDVVVSGNLTVSGTTTTVDTQNIQVTDPIIELGKDNDGSPVVDLGIVMTRPESNVAIIYDESAKSLEIGYTLNGASDSTITMDTANVFDMNVHGNVTMSGTLTLGEFAVVPSYGLDHVTGENNSTSDTIVSTNTQTGFQASSNIVVGRDALISGNLVVGTANLFVDTQTGRVTMNETKVSSNLEVGTSNLFVDTQTGRVGVGTDAPAYDLDVRGTANVSDLTVTSTVNLLHTANTSTIKANSNVVTEFPRSKKLIKYPRVALTADAETGSGYKGYKIDKSSVYGSNPAWRAFDGEVIVNSWLSAENSYTQAGPATGASAVDTFEGINGSWLNIQLPNKIRLDYIIIKNRTSGTIRNAKVGILWAKNTTDLTWYRIHDFSGLDTGSGATNTIYVNETNVYDEYRLQVTEIEPYSDSAPYGILSIGEWELYGIPEYDPEAHGTDVVVKSIPNVPNTDWLEVYYDAKDLGDGAVTSVDDLTPSGTNDGTAIGGVTVSDGAFVLDGAGDYISTSITTSMTVHTASMWIQFDRSGNGWECVYFIGPSSSLDRNNINLYNNNGYFRLESNGGTNGPYFDFVYNFEIGKWVHLTLIFRGTGLEDCEMYINNERLLPRGVSRSSTDDITITGTNNVYVGSDSGNSYYHDGKIANFRLFNRALTSDEIWQLYAYQKEYFGHGDLSMTLKAGRLGIGTSEPKAALDINSGGVRLNQELWVTPAKRNDTVRVSTNTLSFYEEGSWTPTLGAVATPTYTEQFGYYTRIGNIVHLVFRISVTGLDNNDPSGIHISLPYELANNNGHSAMCSFGYKNSLFDPSFSNGGANIGNNYMIPAQGGSGQTEVSVRYNNCYTSGTLLGFATYSLQVTK